MKKLVCVLLFVALLCLSACGDLANGGVSSVAISSTAQTDSQVQELPLSDESLEFSFLSGAGGWRTTLTLNKDGSFIGQYSDSEMGDVGEGYSNGSIYISDFSGKFTNFQKVDEYSYKMTLSEIKTEKTVGEEWIEHKVRYIASEPYGLNDPIEKKECTEFVLYLPTTPINQVSEEFLTWWPYRYDQETEAKTTLSCYGILNVITNFGFFTEP